MRYLLKYSYYMVVGLAFSVIISMVTSGVRAELFPVASVALYLLRVLDDYFDYDTDTKEKLMGKDGLKRTAMALGSLFVLLNILFYGYRGLGSICVLVYMLLENKYEVLKMGFLMLVSVFYLTRYVSLGRCSVMICLALALIVSVIYHIYKKKRAG